jgi:hypothetical protein
MGEGYNFEKFKKAILDLSVSPDWDTAKAEWQLNMVYEDPSHRSCECEHAPIHQICVIKNQKNSKVAEVGNVCVQKFLRLMSNRIFLVIRRLRWDINKSLNPASLGLFEERGVISFSEKEDYLRYWRKRKRLSDDQIKQKLDINNRILAYVDKATAQMIAASKAMLAK